MSSMSKRAAPQVCMKKQLQSDGTSLVLRFVCQLLFKGIPSIFRGPVLASQRAGLDPTC